MAQSLAVINGRVRTMDAAQPRAEAILITGNRIEAVGATTEILARATSSTTIIDAGGSTVLPGFNDAHVHIFSGSVALSQLSLDGARGFEELAERIREHARRHPGAGLLIAKGCSYSILARDERLSRDHLDRVILDRPMLIFAFDHHTAWANTAALKAAGILSGGVVGLGSEVVMGADGFATGELREADAIGLVAALMESGGRDMLGVATGGEPDGVTENERQTDIASLRAGLSYCASLGITSIQNMDGNHYQLELLDAIERSGGLPVRVRMPFHMKNFMPLSDLTEKAALWKQTYASDTLRCDMVKIFMDGVTESHTALFVDDYADRPGWKGEPLFERAQFNAICAAASELDLQIAVHAVGDGAVRMVLDGYEYAAHTTRKHGLRHRIEHIETIHPDDVFRLEDLGVTASMQPIHAPSGDEADAEQASRSLGPSRWPFAFAWRTIAQTGARLVFSTDWPVSPLNPLLSIEAAMTRREYRAGVADQRLSLDDVLYAYTASGAWVEFMEDRKGMLKPGFLADIVILDGDIDAVPHDSISNLKPLVTICNGAITHGLPL